METFHKKLGRPRKYIKKKYGLKDAWVYLKINLRIQLMNQHIKML